MTIRLSRKQRQRRRKTLATRQSQEVTVYHFTNLLDFESILREGVRYGVIPLEDTQNTCCPNAPNVTTNPSPEHQQCWTRGDCTDKTRIRLTVRLPQRELTPFDSIRRQYRLRRRWVEILAPNGEHKHWFFVFGGIPTENIEQVECDVYQDGNYGSLNGHESQALAKAIAQEKERVGCRRFRSGGKWLWSIGNVPTFFWDYRYPLDDYLEQQGELPKTCLIDTLEKEDVFARMCRLNRISDGSLSLKGGSR